MAQPAVPVTDDRTDLLIGPVFWLKPTTDPPNSWDSWIGQFTLAIKLRVKMRPARTTKNSRGQFMTTRLRKRKSRAPVRRNGGSESSRS